MSPSMKSERDTEREQSLVEQWVSLTEERNAVSSYHFTLVNHPPSTTLADVGTRPGPLQPLYPCPMFLIDIDITPNVFFSVQYCTEAESAVGKDYLLSFNFIFLFYLCILGISTKSRQPDPRRARRVEPSWGHGATHPCSVP